MTSVSSSSKEICVISGLEKGVDVLLQAAVPQVLQAPVVHLHHRHHLQIPPRGHQDQVQGLVHHQDIASHPRKGGRGMF